MKHRILRSYIGNRILAKRGPDLLLSWGQENIGMKWNDWLPLSPKGYPKYIWWAWFPKTLRIKTTLWCCSIHSLSHQPFGYKSQEAIQICLEKKEKLLVHITQKKWVQWEMPRTSVWPLFSPSLLSLFSLLTDNILSYYRAASIGST